jgi:hypothetical protein
MMGICILSLVAAIASYRNANAQASPEEGTILPVTSPAIRFSPGNWSGDKGRGGNLYRQTWNSGAYFTCVWSTTAPNSFISILFDNTGLAPAGNLSYSLDGSFTDDTPIPNTAPQGELTIPVYGAGKHTLIVYVRNTEQRDRWVNGGYGTNIVRISAIRLGPNSVPGQVPAMKKWIMILGDSITEGIMANNGMDSNIADYSHLIGEGLKASMGWDYCISACGFSGWLRPGDGSGDVPGYYRITHSVNGEGGDYNPLSRWNKIDGSTSLLDSQGHISAYGSKNTEPAAILINYITNEDLSSANKSDTQASITQALAALRKAAPKAWIFVLTPLGLHNTRIYPTGNIYANVLRKGYQGYKSAHPQDSKCILIDFGVSVSNTLASQLYGANVHPNVYGQAYMAALISPRIMEYLEK